MATLPTSSALAHSHGQPGQAPSSTVTASRRWLLPLAAAALAVATGAAGVWIGRHSAAPQQGVAEASAPSTQASREAARAAASATQALATPPAATAQAHAGNTAARQPAHERSAPATPQTATPTPPQAKPSTPLDIQPTRSAAVCATCGTVESVRSEVQQGQGTGVGAVAGGVVGGLLGNQIGKGNGRTAMTVLGAVGGGLAGNEIEKRQRASTVYVVKVRMDDGTLRSFTRSESWAVGQRVTVDGSRLQTATSATAPAPAPREPMLQTADRGTAR